MANPNKAIYYLNPALFRAEIPLEQWTGGANESAANQGIGISPKVWEAKPGDWARITPIELQKGWAIGEDPALQAFVELRNFAGNDTTEYFTQYVQAQNNANPGEAIGGGFINDTDYPVETGDWLWAITLGVEVPAADWAEFTNPEDDPTSDPRGFGSNMVVESEPTEGCYVLDRDGADKLNVVNFQAEDVWEPAGWPLLPERYTYFGEGNNFSNTRWSYNNMFAGLNSGTDYPPVGGNEQAFGPSAGVNASSSVNYDVVQLGPFTCPGRFVFSLMVDHSMATSKWFGAIDVSSTGGGSMLVEWDYENKTANIVSESGNLSTQRAEFEVQEYRTYKRIVIAFDCSNAGATDFVVNIHLKDNAGADLTATGDGSNVAWWAPMFEEATADNGLFAGIIRRTGGSVGPGVGAVMSATRFRFPASAGSFLDTFNTGEAGGQGGQDLQERGAFYVELTPRADWNHQSGINHGTAPTGGFLSGVLGGDWNSDTSTGDADSARSKYLSHLNTVTKPTTLQNNVDMYGKAANRNNPPYTGLGNYWSGGEDSVGQWQEGVAQRICVIYNNNGDPTGAGGSLQVVINGVLIDQETDGGFENSYPGFTSWGNNCGGEPAGNWTSPGGVSPVPLIFGAAQKGNTGGSFQIEDIEAAVNVQNLYWWKEPLSVAQAIAITQNGYNP